MAQSTEKFADLLTQGIHRIRSVEGKTIQVVQDELGYTLGREGGSAIEYWRKGHVPPRATDVETLGRTIVDRGRMGREWLTAFLASADYPYPANVCDEVFTSLLQVESGAAHRSSPAYTQSKLPAPPAPQLSAETASFIVGLPVTQPARFFGRTYELKRIFGLWSRSPLQNVAVIGPKRSGKTSLLHYLMQITAAPPRQLRPNQPADWLPQPARYRWVFVDFQDVRMHCRETLLRHILQGLHLPIPDRCDLPAFLDSISTNLQTPGIILMDEIGAALTSPELDQHFWWSLRSLGSHQAGGNLAFLLTAHRLPAQIAEEENKPSPFFNIFGHTFNLGPLTEAEAQDLIASSPRAFEAADVAWILEQSRGWPCLLQILCHARLTALEFNETGDSWQKHALNQLAQYIHLLQ